MNTAFSDPIAMTHEQVEKDTAFAPRFDAAGLVTVVRVEADSQ